MNNSVQAGSPWTHPTTFWWLLVWGALIVVAEFTRPILPGDETKYLAVAWEMFQSKSLSGYIVPMLDSQPYHENPPLLFWLITMAWHLLGPNDWAAALIAPVFGLLNLSLTLRIASLIWPPSLLGGDARLTAAIAPVILIGAFVWSMFLSLTTLDMVLTTFVLMSISSLIKAWRWGGNGPWVVIGLAIGLGLLTKGPIIFLYTLPVALLAPLWGLKMVGADPGPAAGYKAWYIGVFFSIIGGVLIALSWAIPAAIFGGDTYRDAVLGSQWVGMFANPQSYGSAWYWYLIALPVMILPWIIWPPLLRAIGRLPFVFQDAGVRLALLWMIPALVALSVFGNKPLHDLLPVFPAIAIMSARLLTEPILVDRAQARDQWWPAIPMGILALGLAGIPYLLGFLSLFWSKIPEQLGLIDGYWMLVVLAVVIVLIFSPIYRLSSRVIAVSALTTTFIISAHMSMKPMLEDRYDLRPLSLDIQTWMAEGLPIAYYGTDRGLFQFSGRLPGPVEQIDPAFYEITDEWARANPDGVMIFQSLEPLTGQNFLYQEPFGGHYMIAWQASEVANDPTRVVDAMAANKPTEPWATRKKRGEMLRPELTEKYRMLMRDRGIGLSAPMTPPENAPSADTALDDSPAIINPDKAPKTSPQAPKVRENQP